jgi:mannosylglycerate hydrolase
MTEPGAPGSGFATAPRIAFLVPHTHWDREWYRTFADFRVSMTRIVREVLDRLEQDPAFTHFLLDGQAILARDHCEIYPEDAERIRSLVREGRMSLGPWYVLPDEFLVSGESLVRNLLAGHSVARELGGVQKVGYMPDSFGHVAQLPQILRGAGIDSFLYTRGNGDEIDHLGFEFIWRAPDGSSVLAINQCSGYCNAGGLGHHEIWHAHTPRELDFERAVDQVRELFGRMRTLGRTDVVLLSNGCDHFPPQRDTHRLLESLSGAFPDTEFRVSSLASFVDAVRDAAAEGDRLDAWEGELRHGRLHHILTGVWSARMPLKQANDLATRWLTDVAEPLAAYARFAHGLADSSPLLGAAWRRLLENHPHDSICGCSIDEVHEQMGPRFDEALETAEGIVREVLVDLAPTFAPRAEGDRDTVLCVANPLPVERREVVRRLVVLQPFGIDPHRLRLYDEDGAEVPMRVLDSKYVERFWGIDYRTVLDHERQAEKFATYLEKFGDRIIRPETRRDESDTFVSLEFIAELPALGHARFFLREADGPCEMEGPDPVRVEDDCLENGLVRVRLYPNGTLDLEDRRSGGRYPGLNLLASTEDVGDEYDYSPAEFSSTVDAAGVRGEVSVESAGRWAATLVARFQLALPQGISADRRSRDSRLVPCPVEVRVGLQSGRPLVEIETRFDNRVRDHRLRARFPTGIGSDTVYSDGHFLVHERPVELPAGEDWFQPPAATIPQQGCSWVSEDERGLALLARGLPEIESSNTADGLEIGLTLLRSVGWLSRDDFPTRRHQNAGPTVPTPAAQCPGPQSFQYALLPLGGSDGTAAVLDWDARWRTPVPVVQGVEAGSARSGSLLSLEAGACRISAVKRHEARDTLVVRLWNPGAMEDVQRLRFGSAIHGAWLTNLLEERQSELSSEGPAGRHLELRLGPHEILTIEIEFESGAGAPVS